MTADPDPAAAPDVADDPEPLISTAEPAPSRPIAWLTGSAPAFETPSGPARPPLQESHVRATSLQQSGFPATARPSGHPDPAIAPVPRPEARPPVVDEPGILGLSRLSRSRLGARLFTWFFVLVYAVIVIQMIGVLLYP